MGLLVGGGGASVPRTLYEVDFATLANQTFPNIATNVTQNVTIDGLTWAMTCAGSMPSTCAIVNGTGLVISGDGGVGATGVIFQRKLTDFGSNLLLNRRPVCIDTAVDQTGGTTGTTQSICGVGLESGLGTSNFATAGIMQRRGSFLGYGIGTAYSAGKKSHSFVSQGGASSNSVAGNLPEVMRLQVTSGGRLAETYSGTYAAAWTDDSKWSPLDLLNQQTVPFDATARSLTMGDWQVFMVVQTTSSRNLINSYVIRRLRLVA